MLELRKNPFALIIAFVFACNHLVVAQDETGDVVESQQSEEEKPKEYTFAIEANLDRTDVKSQDSTGTCWCFATASFFESELLRQGKGEHNLSEMFIVRNIYNQKARNYLLRKGKTQFGEGGLSHDFMNAAREHGLMPEAAYSGLIDGSKRHSHGEMVKILKAVLDSVVENRKLGKKWAEVYDATMNVYLGEAPAEFEYNGKTYTPKAFADELEFDAKDYISLTSYTHHPFYDSFVLEIPDNFSSGSYMNVPVDELVEVIDYAVNNGYTVAWDGDVSERGFSSNKGIAVLPKNARSDAHSVPGDEVDVDQEMRQSTLEEFSTTDDHLMHLTGTATDQNGTRYYIIKNSWGEVGPYDGYLYMSEAYVRLKTVAIMIHKDALPEHIKAKFAGGKITRTAETSDSFSKD